MISFDEITRLIYSIKISRKIDKKRNFFACKIKME